MGAGGQGRLAGGESRPTQMARGNPRASWTNKPGPSTPLGGKEASSQAPRGRGLKETAPRDEPLWDMAGFTPTTPRNQLWGINYDFSSFPVVCEATYDELARRDTRLRRQMPFCAFQHVMTEYLNGALIQRTFDNNEGRFPGETQPVEVISEEMVVLPESVATIIETAVNTSTPAGDEVRFNLPEAGTPLWSQAPIEEDGSEIPSGLFGIANAAQHNAYECYVSPRVTAGLVGATAAYNGRNPPAQPWQPLPAGYFPRGGVPNRNLLGWREPERLTVEALNVIEGVIFADGETMEARLCHSGGSNYDSLVKKFMG